MEVLQILADLGKVSVPEFLLLYGLLPFAVNVASNASQGVIELLSTTIVGKLRDDQQTWDELFVNAFSRAVDDCYEIWRSKSQLARTFGRRHDAKSSVAEFKRKSVDVLLAAEIDATTVYQFVSRLDEIRRGDYTGLELDNHVMRHVMPCIPKRCPPTLKATFERHLAHNLARRLAQSTSQDEQVDRYLVSIVETILGELEDISQNEVELSEEDKRSLGDAVAKELGTRIELMTITNIAEVNQLKAELKNYHDTAIRVIRETGLEISENLVRIRSDTRALIDLTASLDDFRPDSVYLQASPMQQGGSPWPIRAGANWPTILDFRDDMVVRTDHVDTIQSRLEDEDRILLVTGPSASGKTTLARYVAHNLKERGWQILFLGGLKESPVDVYSRLSIRKLMRQLNNLGFVDTRVLLIFDDVHVAPDKVLDLYSQVRVEHLPVGIKFLLVGNSSLFSSEHPAAADLPPYTESPNDQLKVRMMYQDVVGAIRRCLMHHRDDMDSTLDEETMSSYIQEVHRLCGGNWIVLRSFLQSQPYDPSTRFLSTTSLSAPDTAGETFLQKLKEDIQAGLSSEERLALWIVASLSSLGIPVERGYLERRELIVHATELWRRGLLTVDENGHRFGLEHPATAKLYLEACFGRKWCEKVKTNYRSYLFSEPGNYVDALAMPILTDEVAVLRYALRGDKRDEALQHVNQLLKEELDIVVKSNCLHYIFRADRDFAAKLIQEQKQEMIEQLSAESIGISLANLMKGNRLVS